VTNGVGSLDGRAIGNGISEGNTELNYIGTALFHSKENMRSVLNLREAGSDIGNERSLQ
jgi:hypothetical protein